MKQQLTIDCYVSKGLPKLDAFVRDLRDLMQEYKNAGAGKFDYTLIEAKDEDQRKKAKEAGLIEQPFGEASDTDEKAAVTEGFMGLVFKYGEQQDVIKFLPPDRTDGLEFWITNKIREIRDKGDDIHHKIGVLTGHDELKPSDNNLAPTSMGKFSMQGIITQNFPFYSFQDVDLKGGDAAISDDLDGLLITQPGKDLNEKELRRIDQFVMKGKSLAVFASAVNTKASDATMSANLNRHGLDTLLEGYGIQMNKDVVLDLARHATIVGAHDERHGPRRPAAGPRHPGRPALHGRPAAHRHVLSRAVPRAGGGGAVRVQPQARARQAAGGRPSRSSRARRRPPCTCRARRSTCASARSSRPGRPCSRACSRSSSPSAPTSRARSSRPSPAATSRASTRPTQSAKPARVFVLASAEFLCNPLARAGNGPDMGQYGQMMPNLGGDEQLLMLASPYAQQFVTGSILVFKNTLDWLTGDTDLLAVSAKILSDPNLVYGDAQASRSRRT